MTINFEKINSKLKYFLLFVFVLLVYIYGGNESFTFTYKIPMFIFFILEGISILKKKKMKITTNITILYIFDLYLFLSMFWSIDASNTIEISKTVFLLTTFLLLLYNFLYYEDKSQEKLLKILMYAGIVFSIYVIMYYGISNYYNMLINGLRIGKEIDNVNSIGLGTSVTFLIILYFALNSNNKFYIFLSVIPLIVAFGTGSRKVIIILLLGSLLLLFFKSEKKDIKNIIKKIFLITVFIFLIYFIVNLFGEVSVFKRLEGLINSVTGSGKVDSSTILRKKYIEYGIMQFKETPLLGIGAGNSRYITMKLGHFTYLHNNFVELLATTGIIGFFLYYYNYFYIIKEIVSLKKLSVDNKKLKVLVLSIFIILLVIDYGMVSYYNKKTYIYFLIGLNFLKNRGDTNV